MTSQRVAKPKASQAASSQSTSSQRTSSQTASSPQSTSSQPTSSQTSSSQPTSSQNVHVTAASSQPGPKPRGAELARVLKVGDRVKPVTGWYSYGLRPDHQGRVTAIPSRIAVAHGCGPSGYVDVRWDGVGGEDYCHSMGDRGVYTLDLV